MVDTITPVYKFTQPEVGQSADSWGDKLNANWGKVDSLLTPFFVGGTAAILGTGMKISSADPQLQFNETDQTDPDGRYRFRGLNETFTFERALTANYATTSVIWNVIGGVMTMGAPLVTALTTIGGNAPELRFAEGDQTDPTGRFRFLVDNNGIGLQRTTAANWATPVVIWNYVGGATNRVTFGAPVTFLNDPLISSIAPALEFRETDRTLPAGLFRFIGTGAFFKLQANTAAAGDFSTVTDIFTAGSQALAINVPINPWLTIESNNPQLRFSEGDQTDPVGQWRFSLDNNIISLQRAASANWGSNTNIWRVGSGDFIFDVPVYVADLATVAGTAPEMRFTESAQTDPAGQFRFLANANSFSFQRAATANWATQATIWNYINSTNKVNIGVGVTVAAEVDAVGLGKFGSAYCNAVPAGTGAIGRFSSAAGVLMSLQSGGASITCYDSAATIIGQVAAPGASASSSYTLITREKGDARYSAISARRFKEAVEEQDEKPLLHAFGKLRLHTWRWGGDTPEHDERHGRQGVGLIAEEVAKVFPAAVTHQWVPTGEDADGQPVPETKTRVNGLDPLALIAVLVAKIRQQETRISALEGAHA